MLPIRELCLPLLRGQTGQRRGVIIRLGISAVKPKGLFRLLQNRHFLLKARKTILEITDDLLLLLWTIPMDLGLDHEFPHYLFFQYLSQIKLLVGLGLAQILALLLWLLLIINVVFQELLEVQVLICLLHQVVRYRFGKSD